MAVFINSNSHRLRYPQPPPLPSPPSPPPTPPHLIRREVGRGGRHALSVTLTLLIRRENTKLVFPSRDPREFLTAHWKSAASHPSQSPRDWTAWTREWGVTFNLTEYASTSPGLQLFARLRGLFQSTMKSSWTKAPLGVEAENLLREGGLGFRRTHEPGWTSCSVGRGSQSKLKNARV